MLTILYATISFTLVFITYYTTKKIYKNRYKNAYRRNNNQRLNSVYFPPSQNDILNLYTVATSRTQGLDRLIKSCNDHGIGIHVLGISNKWQGYGNKWLWVAEYIKLQNLPDDSVVAFVDAYDVLALSNPDEILNKFKSFNARAVFSAEIHCYPDPNLSKDYPFSNSRFKYLNSGGAIGYAKDIVRIIDAINFQTTDDDQGAFTNYYLSHPGEIFLDYDCKIFFSLFGVSENDFQLDDFESRVIVMESNQKPCFIHGNGTSTKLLDALHDALSTRQTNS